MSSPPPASTPPSDRTSPSAPGAVRGADDDDFYTYPLPGLLGPFASPAVIDAENVILAFTETDGVTGAIQSINVVNGTVNWTFQQVNVLFLSTPAVSSDAVYVGGSDGNLYAVSLADGSLRFTAGSSAAVSAPPLVAGDLVIFTNEQTEVIAVDAATGQQRWMGQIIPNGYNGPARGRMSSALAVGDRIIVAASGQNNTDSGSGTNGWVYAFSAAASGYTSGAEVYSPGVELSSDLALSDDGSLLFFGCVDGSLRALDVGDGSLVFSQPGGAAIVGRPGYLASSGSDPGWILWGDTGGTFHARQAVADPSTPSWIVAVGQPITTAVLVDQGYAFFGTYASSGLGGYFYVMDVGQGSAPVASALTQQLPYAFLFTPIVADGMVSFANDQLYLVDVGVYTLAATRKGA